MRALTVDAYLAETGTPTDPELTLHNPFAPLQQGLQQLQATLSNATSYDEPARKKQRPDPEKQRQQEQAIATQIQQINAMRELLEQQLLPRLVASAITVLDLGTWQVPNSDYRLPQAIQTALNTLASALAKPFYQQLAAMRQLKKLSLSCSLINDAFYVFIANSYRVLHHLQHLQLSQATYDTKRLTDACAKNFYLTQVTVGKNTTNLASRELMHLRNVIAHLAQLPEQGSYSDSIEIKLTHYSMSIIQGLAKLQKQLNRLRDLSELRISLSPATPLNDKQQVEIKDLFLPFIHSGKANAITVRISDVMCEYKRTDGSCTIGGKGKIAVAWLNIVLHAFRTTQTSVQTLNLAACTSVELAGSSFYTHLAKMAELRTLSLSHTFVNDAFYAFIANNIEVPHRLQQLFLAEGHYDTREKLTTACATNFYLEQVTIGEQATPCITNELTHLRATIATLIQLPEQHSYDKPIKITLSHYSPSIAQGLVSLVQQLDRLRSLPLLYIHISATTLDAKQQTEIATMLLAFIHSGKADSVDIRFNDVVCQYNRTKGICHITSKIVLAAECLDAVAQAFRSTAAPVQKLQLQLISPLTELENAIHPLQQRLNTVSPAEFILSSSAYYADGIHALFAPFISSGAAEIVEIRFHEFTCHYNRKEGSCAIASNRKIHASWLDTLLHAFHSTHTPLHALHLDADCIWDELTTSFNLLQQQLETTPVSEFKLSVGVNVAIGNQDAIKTWTEKFPCIAYTQQSPSNYCDATGSFSYDGALPTKFLEMLIRQNKPLRSLSIKAINQALLDVLLQYADTTAIYTLHTLHIENTPIPREQYQTLEKILGKLPLLNRLSIIRCEFTDEGMRQLEQVLIARTHLSELDFSHNPLGESALHTIANIVKNNRQVYQVALVKIYKPDPTRGYSNQPINAVSENQWVAFAKELHPQRQTSAHSLCEHDLTPYQPYVAAIPRHQQAAIPARNFYKATQDSLDKISEIPRKHKTDWFGAVQRGDLTTVRDFIKIKQVSVYVSNETGDNALHLAVRSKQQKKLVTELLQHINSHVPNREGHSAIALADESLLVELKQAASKWDAPKKQSKPAKQTTLPFTSQTTATTTTTSTSTSSTLAPTHPTPLHIGLLYASNGNTDLLMQLHGNNSGLQTVRNAYGQNALMLALLHGHFTLAKMLAPSFVLTDVDNAGMSVLHFYCQALAQHPLLDTENDLLQLLLDRGANAGHADVYHYSALVHLCLSRYATPQSSKAAIRALRLLHHRGADITIKITLAGYGGNLSLLHLLILQQQLPLAKALLKIATFDPNQADAAGNGAFHHAVSIASPAAVALLLAFTHVNLQQTNAAGQTPLQQAITLRGTEPNEALDKIITQLQTTRGTGIAASCQEIPIVEMALTYPRLLGDESRIPQALKAEDIHDKLCKSTRYVRAEESPQGNHLTFTCTVLVRKRGVKSKTYYTQRITLDDSYEEINAITVSNYQANLEQRQRLAPPALQQNAITDLQQLTHSDHRWKYMLHPDLIPQLSHMQGISFAQLFHHTEQKLVCWFELYAAQLVSYISASLNLEDATQYRIKALIIDLHSELNVCPNCVTSLLAMQHPDALFRQNFTAALRAAGYDCAPQNPLAIIVRTSYSKSASSHLATTTQIPAKPIPSLHYALGYGGALFTAHVKPQAEQAIRSRKASASTTTNTTKPKKNPPPPSTQTNGLHKYGFTKK